MSWLWLALGVAAVAALLLAWILLEARGVAREAERTLAAAVVVETNTAALWAIPQVNALLGRGDAVLRDIAAKAEAVADAVDPPPKPSPQIGKHAPEEER